jgi:hypothetical protein
MPSQQDLIDDCTLTVFEDLSHSAALKTTNPEDDPRQRQVITDRGRESSEFKATVRLAACVHGVLDRTAATPVPASLIILQFTLNSLHRKHTYRSLYTVLSFAADAADSADVDPRTNPQIIAFAPFEKATAAHGVEVEKTRTKEVGLHNASITGPGGIGVALSGNVSRGEQKQYQMRYAQLLQASRHVSHHGSLGYDTVWWNMRESQVLRDGIPTALRVAVLLQRSSLDKRFIANFKMRLDAGTWYKVKERWNDFWGLLESDDPIVFDPNLPPMGEMEGIDPENLGNLRKGDDLQTLGAFWNPEPHA